MKKKGSGKKKIISRQKFKKWKMKRKNNKKCKTCLTRKTLKHLKYSFSKKYKKRNKTQQIKIRIKTKMTTGKKKTLIFS